MGEIAIRMSGCSQPFVDLDSTNPRCARLFHRLRSVPMCRSYICRYLRNQPFKCDSAPEAAPFVQSKHEARSLGSTKVTTRLSGGPSSVDQQRRAGGKFCRIGSKVKDGSCDFFA